MDYATSGTLNLTGTTHTATAVTPEVATWMLTLTGTVLLFVVARRRKPLLADGETQAFTAFTD